MTAQQLLTLNLIARNAWHLVAQLEDMSNEFSDFEDQSNSNDGTDVLMKAVDTLHTAHEHMQTVAEHIDGIVNADDDEYKNDFLSSLPTDDRVLLDQYLGEAVTTYRSSFFSPSGIKWLSNSVKSEADRVRLLDIYQRGLDWFDARLLSSSSE